MTLIRLNWERPVDGAEIVADPKVEAAPTIETRLLRCRSEALEPVVYEISNLESPLSLRLLNMAGDDDLVTFASRFGLPAKMLTPNQVSVSSVLVLREDIEEVFRLGKFPDSIDKARHANDVLRHVSLSPSFEYANGKNKLVMRPTNLSDLLMMEAVFAYEVGATISRCAHCSKAYLTGPLTGRRSHAVYCSDRCRVAAMRKRNAASQKDA